MQSEAAQLLAVRVNLPCYVLPIYIVYTPSSMNPTLFYCALINLIFSQNMVALPKQHLQLQAHICSI